MGISYANTENDELEELIQNENQEFEQEQGASITETIFIGLKQSSPFDS